MTITQHSIHISFLSSTDLGLSTCVSVWLKIRIRMSFQQMEYQTLVELSGDVVNQEENLLF